MKKGLIAGLLIVALAAGGGVYYYKSNEWGNSLSEDIVYVTSVATITGQNTSVLNRYAGIVESQNTVKISADSNRVVKQIYVEQGDEVKAGQLLFEYDESSLEDQLSQAQLDLERLRNEALSYQEQISTLEKEKAKAKESEQLSYTIEIETNKMNLKKNEYDQKSKQAEIDKLQASSGNTEVRSEIDGVVQKIDTSKITTDSSSTVSDTLVYDSSYGDYSSDSTDNTFITILSTGSFRVKGQVNELNYSNLIPGSAMIIRSRKDESQTWTGTLSGIDTENSVNTDSYSYFGMSSTTEQTSSSSYPFYVTLDSSEGLMLGQHVYIELDEGQNNVSSGMWLNEYFLVDTDKTDPYVWAADEKGRLTKKYVVIGQYDQYLMQYEVVSGLEPEDAIAFPVDSLKEGMTTRVGSAEETLSSMYDETYMDEMNEEDFVDFESEEYQIIEEDPSVYDESELETDMDAGWEDLESFEEPELIYDTQDGVADDGGES